MKPLIEKIAKDVNAWFPNGYPSGEGGDEEWLNYVIFKKDQLQKFAEMIIRECMGIISDESEKVSDEWRCKDGKHIWWKIKEHFGVE